MTVTFASSGRSTVGLEWEIMLADGDSGDLVGRAGEVTEPVGEATKHERYTVTEELLTNTVEVTSGIGDTVEAAVDDIADARSSTPWPSICRTCKHSRRRVRSGRASARAMHPTAPWSSSSYRQRGSLGP